MKLNLTATTDRIYFRNEENGFMGYTTYDADLFKKLNSVTWNVNTDALKAKKKTYIFTYSKKLRAKTLHQVVMIHWYGLDNFEKARAENFIVEHHDNNAFNCLIENLSFAPNNVNLAKAQTYDKERKIALPFVAMNIFKDFKTKKYQITLGFNQEFFISFTDGTDKSLTSLSLLYEDDFRIVINDASNLLYNLTEYKKFVLDKLQSIDYSYTESIYILPEADGTLPAMVEIDGRWAIVLSEETRLHSVAPDSKLYEK
ncbi:hypothetical protein [Paenibacillus sp. FSL R5-0914]|uniref:hypothetical protein n=1 Tax=Paenibacillus sp. FSL R5-0914 TaxID=2921665 RepID=UPI0030F730C5